MRPNFDSSMVWLACDTQFEGSTRERLLGFSPPTCLCGRRLLSPGGGLMYPGLYPGLSLRLEGTPTADTQSSSLHSSTRHAFQGSSAFLGWPPSHIFCHRLYPESLSVTQESEGCSGSPPQCQWVAQEPGKWTFIGCGRPGRTSGRQLPTERPLPATVSCRGCHQGSCEMVAPSALLAGAPPCGSTPLHRAQFPGTLLSGQAPRELSMWLKK